ncbi:hypothetical protein ACFL2D_02080 [Patescibacteria group bacterium]
MIKNIYKQGVFLRVILIAGTIFAFGLIAFITNNNASAQDEEPWVCEEDCGQRCARSITRNSCMTWCEENNKNNGCEGEEDEVIIPDVETDDAADEMQELYRQMADEEVEVPECSEEYPELCVLPLELTNDIIEWFYEDMMERLRANFKHTLTITDADGTERINWGMPFGWGQRVMINLEKYLRFGDTRPDAGYCANASLGTCGDVMAYFLDEFPKRFPNVKITKVSMAWGPGGFFNHGANIVMPINPKTKKQYLESEIPSEIFSAKRASELPVQWQNAMVLDGWGRNIYPLKDWYSNYKNGDGEFAVGD